MGDNPSNPNFIAYMEEDNLGVNPTNDTAEETVETLDATPSEETLETPEVDVEQLQATNKKLFERAKKAEADLRALKSSGSTPPAQSTSPQSVSVEETVLLANGMSEELLNELKAVAKARGISSLIKAQTDSIFVAVKEKFERDLKQREASLPASRSSGAAKVKKSPRTPGLSRDDHKKMVMESLG